MAGYLPFDEADLPTLYKKVSWHCNGCVQPSGVISIPVYVYILHVPVLENNVVCLPIVALCKGWQGMIKPKVWLLQINAAFFSCPPWFSHGAAALIRRILDPNPKTVRSTAFFPPLSFTFKICDCIEFFMKIMNVNYYTPISLGYNPMTAFAVKEKPVSLSWIIATMESLWFFLCAYLYFNINICQP